MKLDQLNTPALIVDLDAMEANLRHMAEFFAGRPCKLRPHFKNHKSPKLAWKQMRAGAIGITCATVREAEILVEHGIESVLIANEIAGSVNAERLAALCRSAPVMVCIDNCFSVARSCLRTAQLQVAALKCWWMSTSDSIDAAWQPGQAALELARYAVEHGLAVRGIMGYDGHLQAIPPGPDRDDIVRQGSQAIVESAMLLEDAGIAAPIRSTGGTGTYAVSGQHPGITEIQAGSYLLMDNLYASRRAPFARSLTVLTTVVSTRGSEHAVLDCGVKAISGERGLPTLKDVPGSRVAALHAEHAIVVLEPQSPALTPGQKVELWVHYSDATVNLHSKMYGVRNGEVEEVFPIEH